MKVLHITPTFEPAIGGIETVIANLVCQSSKHGIVADVLHTAPGLTSREEVNGFGTRTWRRPLVPHRLLGQISGLSDIVDSYDLLHAHDPQVAAISTNLIFAGRGKPRILSTHGGFFHSKNGALFKKAHWNSTAPLLLRQYDIVLASSTSDEKAFRSKCANLRLAANGVDVEASLALARPADGSARRWLYWGRLSRNKRLHLVIDLVASLKKRGFDVSLTIAGPDFDGLSDTLQNQVLKLNLDDIVTVRPQLTKEELSQEVLRHDVYISATEYEGFGLTLIEAMAAGLIVISTDIPPINGFISSGQNGLLLDFDGSERDFLKLEGILRSSVPQLQAIRDAARKSAALYDWSTAFEPFKTAYLDVIRETQQPRKKAGG